MAISDKPMTYKEFRAIQSLLTTELQLTPKEWLKILGTNMDSAGTAQYLMNTSGQITEASASNINTNTSAIELYQRYSNSLPSFGTPPNTATPAFNFHRRLFQSTLTATAGGEIVAANVGPPTLAGYQGCMIITHVYSDQTTANITFTIAASAGALTGLATMDISTTANTVSPDYNQGLAWQCGTDAATIQFACAAGQAGNAQNVTFIGYYWYET